MVWDQSNDLNLFKIMKLNNELLFLIVQGFKTKYIDKL